MLYFWPVELCFHSLRSDNECKRHTVAQCEWLTPVILATQEVEIRKQAQENSSRDPISKVPNRKKGWQGG
jgi:hypothetical protein